MEKKVTTPAKAPVKSVATAKPAAAKPVANKGMMEKSLKAAAKTKETICGELKKKILTNKLATLPEITEIGGVNKAEMMKLIEILDVMGSNTYNTACALRELQQRMK